MERNENPVRNGNYGLMNAVLRDVPEGIRQIYVLSAGSLQRANPEYVRLALGVPSEIVRLGEIAWNCPETSDFVRFNHEIADGVVSTTITLPNCANFYFDTSDPFEIPNGRLHRSDAMSYELPDAHPRETSKWWYLGRRMTVHVRPNGPARFVIEHGGSNGMAWFDTP
jgi:hypothetical protein